MKQNVFDRATDILKERMSAAKGQLRKDFGKANPYRMQPKPPKERLMEYAEFTPEVEALMRQQMGDMAVDLYKNKMERLKGRYQNNG